MTRAMVFLRDSRGATAAEFALVLPLLLMLMFGLIDAGRFMWEYNEAEKATQMGVRFAVATNMVSGQPFADYSFATSAGVPQGTAVPPSEFDRITCTQASCSCTGGAACSVVALDSTAFAKIVARMRAMYGSITADKVEVEYRNVGLGYAGDPNGPDVAPLVTVRLKNLVFRPLSCMYFLCGVSMPNFRAALTLEDGAGAVSN